jgi:hypothetical protein
VGDPATEPPVSSGGALGAFDYLDRRKRFRDLAAPSLAQLLAQKGPPP